MLEILENTDLFQMTKPKGDKKKRFSHRKQRSDLNDETVKEIKRKKYTAAQTTKIHTR